MVAISIICFSFADEYLDNARFSADIRPICGYERIRTSTPSFRAFVLSAGLRHTLLQVLTIPICLHILKFYKLLASSPFVRILLALSGGPDIVPRIVKLF